jgi:CxxC motif-containing protein (DUF1111 family)
MVPRRLIVGAIIAAATAPVIASGASLDASIGRELFDRNWVSAPSSAKSNDGLGPLYNATSCGACHIRNANAEIDEASVPPGTVVRIGNAKGGSDPIYGRQLQTRAVANQKPEANPDITWSTTGSRRVASIKLFGQAYGPLSSESKLALRRTSSLFGIGLLAQIPDQEILKRADPDDANKDGISGRASMVSENGKQALGRFGWRATQTSLAAQASMAFHIDIGLSTDAHPDPWGDCTAVQSTCRAGPHGATKGEVEIPKSIVDLIVTYLESLPAPAPVDTMQAEVEHGQRIFFTIGCALCHTSPGAVNGQPVAAYTDMLLHDMGPGLNDGIAEGSAQAGEWRTAPLWNLGFNARITGLLHDGRAASVTEAIQWHDGEAAQVRMRFNGLTLAEKDALIAFVSRL